jgi:hypothetical protein
VIVYLASYPALSRFVVVDATVVDREAGDRYRSGLVVGFRPTPGEGILNCSGSSDGVTSGQIFFKKCEFVAERTKLSNKGGAKPSPPTSPTAMQPQTTSSKTLRRISLSWKQPWRFPARADQISTIPTSFHG